MPAAAARGLSAGVGQFLRRCDPAGAQGVVWRGGGSTRGQNAGAHRRVVDCRSRYGGSQYLNSTATGPYADYVVNEILPALDVKYTSLKDGTSPIIAGHSSGGYGALLFGINQHEKFSAVVALSPDSNFDITHKPLVQNPNVAGRDAARNWRRRDGARAQCQAPSRRPGADGPGAVCKLRSGRRESWPLRMAL